MENQLNAQNEVSEVIEKTQIERFNAAYHAFVDASNVARGALELSTKKGAPKKAETSDKRQTSTLAAVDKLTVRLEKATVLQSNAAAYARSSKVGKAAVQKSVADVLVNFAKHSQSHLARQAQGNATPATTTIEVAGYGQLTFEARKFSVSGTGRISAVLTIKAGELVLYKGKVALVAGSAKGVLAVLETPQEDAKVTAE